MKDNIEKFFSLIPSKIQIPIGSFVSSNVINLQRKILGAKKKIYQGNHYLKVDGGHQHTLLLIHGFADSKDGWLEVALSFKKHYNLIIPDLPGFGDNPQDQNIQYTLSYEAQVLYDIWQHESGQPLHVVGISLGAAVAMEMILTWPQVAKSLTLIAAAGFFLEEHHSIFHELLEGKNIFCLETPKDFDSFLGRVMTNAPYIPKPVRLHLGDKMAREKNWLNKMARDLLEGLEGIPDQQKLKHLTFNEKVKNISCPTLILWGENDSFFPAVLSKIPHQNIKHSKLIIFPNIGHAVHREGPKLVYQEIYKFIDLL